MENPYSTEGQKASFPREERLLSGSNQSPQHYDCGHSLPIYIPLEPQYRYVYPAYRLGNTETCHHTKDDANYCCYASLILKLDNRGEKLKPCVILTSNELKKEKLLLNGTYRHCSMRYGLTGRPQHSFHTQRCQHSLHSHSFTAPLPTSEEGITQAQCNELSEISIRIRDLSRAPTNKSTPELCKC